MGTLASASAALLLLGSVPAFAATPVPVKATPAYEHTVAAGKGFIAWAQNSSARPGHIDVFAERTPGVHHIFQVNAPGTNAFAGGIDGTRLVYQQILQGESNLRLYDLVTHRRTNLPPAVNSSRWEFASSISGDWLLFTRESRSAPGWRIMLYNMVTHEMRSLDQVSGRRTYAAAGEVSGDYAVWQKCSPAIRCQVFRYQISNGKQHQIPNPGKYQYAPSVDVEGTTYYARGGQSCGSHTRLMRDPLGGKPATITALPAHVDVQDTYVRSGVGTKLFFDRLGCRSQASDIYKITVS